MQENRTRTNRAALAARRALGLARGSLAAAVSFTAVQRTAHLDSQRWLFSGAGSSCAS